MLIYLFWLTSNYNMFALWLYLFLALPEVSLLQKNPMAPVVCQATGFLPKNASIVWRKNRKPLNNTQLVNLGVCRPNEDGTFQMYAALYVILDEWKKDKYVCVVEHKSWTETIQKILTEDEIKRNSSDQKSELKPQYYKQCIYQLYAFKRTCSKIWIGLHYALCFTVLNSGTW